MEEIPKTSLKEELITLINSKSAENGSNLY
jgi:hypothetical protein